VRAFVAVGLVAATLAAAPPARADGDSDVALFQGAVTALEQGAIDDAIDRFELLADRGFTHPDASYDRGIAYVRRAASRAGKRGDLGRASAALAEALTLRPDDDRASASAAEARPRSPRLPAREAALRTYAMPRS